jgi:hypothetical protein
MNESLPTFIPPPGDAPAPDASAALEAADAVLETETQAGDEAEGVDPGAGDYNLAAIPGLVEPNDSTAEGVVGALESFAADVGCPPEPLREGVKALAEGFEQGAFADAAGFRRYAHEVGKKLGFDPDEVHALIGAAREAMEREQELGSLMQDHDFGKALFDPAHPRHRDARAKWDRVHGR